MIWLTVSREGDPLQVAQDGRDMGGWDLRTRLLAVRERLRPAERRVADFLLNEGHHYHDFTLSDLAQRTGASQSAIVHMCQTLGLSGFREFRLLWVRESAIESACDVSESVIFRTLFSELLRTEQLLAGELDKAAVCVAGAKKVFIFGSGGSGLVAELAAEGLAVAGRLAFTLSSNKRITSTFFDSETVVLVISHKGENNELAEAMERARNAGATTVLITGAPDSRLASIADILLLTSAPKEGAFSLATAEVRTLQLAAVYALVTAVGRYLKPEEADVDAFWKLERVVEHGE